MPQMGGFGGATHFQGTTNFGAQMNGATMQQNMMGQWWGATIFVFIFAIMNLFYFIKNFFFNFFFSGATNHPTQMPAFQANDFGLEFLEHLPAEGATFTAQDLLNSLENDSFNIQDILWN